MYIGCINVAISKSTPLVGDKGLGVLGVLSILHNIPDVLSLQIENHRMKDSQY